MNKPKKSEMPVAAATPCSASSWLPIESAPRDGSRILVVMGGIVTLARWNDQKHHAKPKPYWYTVDQISVARDRGNQPSVWMPLPSLPKVKSAATGSERKDHE